MDNGFSETVVDSEAMISAMADQDASKGELMTVGGTNITAQGAIITAQKVAVERDHSKIFQKLKVLAAAAGESWYYRWPTKNKNGSTGWVEGPSIKLANNLAREYGNCQVNVRAFDQPDHWLFYARFVDVETGYSLERAFQQRKNQSTSKKMDKDRELDIVFQIGQSKAIRNVIVNALETHADFAMQEAKQQIVAKVGKDLDGWREKILDRLKEIKFDVRRVERVVGKSSDQWLAKDIARLVAELHSINDGMATADETYPPIAPGDEPTIDQFEAQDKAGQSQTKTTEPEEKKATKASKQDAQEETKAEPEAEKTEDQAAEEDVQDLEPLEDTEEDLENEAAVTEIKEALAACENPGDVNALWQQRQGSLNKLPKDLRQELHKAAKERQQELSKQ